MIETKSMADTTHIQDTLTGGLLLNIEKQESAKSPESTSEERNNTLEKGLSVINEEKHQVSATGVSNCADKDQEQIANVFANRTQTEQADVKNVIDRIVTSVLDDNALKSLEQQSGSIDSSSSVISEELNTATECGEKTNQCFDDSVEENPEPDSSNQTDNLITEKTQTPVKINTKEHNILHTQLTGSSEDQNTNNEALAVCYDRIDSDENSQQPSTSSDEVKCGSIQTANSNNDEHNDVNNFISRDREVSRSDDCLDKLAFIHCDKKDVENFEPHDAEPPSHSDDPPQENTNVCHDSNVINNLESHDREPSTDSDDHSDKNDNSYHDKKQLDNSQEQLEVINIASDENLDQEIVNISEHVVITNEKHHAIENSSISVVDPINELVKTRNVFADKKECKNVQDQHETIGESSKIIGKDDKNDNVPEQDTVNVNSEHQKADENESSNTNDDIEILAHNSNSGVSEQVNKTNHVSPNKKLLDTKQERHEAICIVSDENLHQKIDNLLEPDAVIVTNEDQQESIFEKSNDDDIEILAIGSNSDINKMGETRDFISPDHDGKDLGNCKEHEPICTVSEVNIDQEIVYENGTASVTAGKKQANENEKNNIIGSVVNDVNKINDVPVCDLQPFSNVQKSNEVQHNEVESCNLKLATEDVMTRVEKDIFLEDLQVKQKIPVETAPKSNFDIIELSDDEVELLETSKSSKCTLELQCEDDNENDFLKNNNGVLCDIPKENIGTSQGNKPENITSGSVSQNNDQSVINNTSIIHFPTAFYEQTLQAVEALLIPQVLVPSPQVLSNMLQVNNLADNNETSVLSTNEMRTRSEINNIVSKCRDLEIPLKRCDDMPPRSTNKMKLRNSSKQDKQTTPRPLVDSKEKPKEKFTKRTRPFPTSHSNQNSNHAHVFGEVFSTDLSFSALSAKTVEQEKSHLSSERIKFLEVRDSNFESLSRTTKKRKVTEEVESVKYPEAKQKKTELSVSSPYPVKLSNSSTTAENNLDMKESTLGLTVKEKRPFCAHPASKSEMQTKENSNVMSQKEKSIGVNCEAHTNDDALNVSHEMAEQSESSDILGDNSLNSFSEESSSELEDFDLNSVESSGPGKTKIIPCEQIAALNVSSNKDLNKVFSISSGKTNDKEYQCFLCDKNFNNCYQLKHHFVLHVRKIVESEIANYQKQNECMFCEKPLHSKQALKFHIQKKHFVKEQPTHACNFCSAWFTTKVDLQKHFELHHRSLLCPSTSRSLVDQDDLTDDIQIEYQNIESEKHESGQEHSKSPVKDKSQHLSQTHIEEKSKNQRNGIKRKSSSSKTETGKVTFKEDESVQVEPPSRELRKSKDTNTRTNTGTTHNRSSPEKSTKASTTSGIQETDVSRKKGRARALNIEKFRCKVRNCSKTFPSRSSLQKHVELFHTDKENEFKCQFCKLQLSAKGSLEEHVKQHHPTAGSAKNIHVCKICSRSFPLASHLDQHIRVAHEEKAKKTHTSPPMATNELFKCPVCGKITKQIRTLMMHLRAKHGDLV